MESILIFNKILAIATIAGVALFLKLVFIFLLRKKITNNKLYRWFIDKKIWMTMALSVTLSAVAITLVYSELIGFPPCRLCWFQRAFMYPSFLLLLLGTIRKKIPVAPFVQALSAGGVVIATYHYLVQMSPSFSIACGEGASCAARMVFEFGFITIPFMSLVGFSIIFTLMMFQKEK